MSYSAANVIRYTGSKIKKHTLTVTITLYLIYMYFKYLRRKIPFCYLCLSMPQMYARVFFVSAHTCEYIIKTLRHERATNLMCQSGVMFTQQHEADVLLESQWTCRKNTDLCQWPYVHDQVEPGSYRVSCHDMYR